MPPHVTWDFSQYHIHQIYIYFLWTEGNEISTLGNLKYMFLLFWYQCIFYYGYMFNKLLNPMDIEYNKRLDHRRPCFEDDLTAGSNL